MGRRVFWSIVIVWHLYQTEIVKGSPCNKDATIGASKPQNIKDKVDAKSGQITMMRHKDFVVPCCGAISQWSAYIKNPGTIRFQVWRALGTGEYTLIGENFATYHKKEENNLITLNVGEVDQIAVKDGDFIGWYNENSPMVSYNKEKDSAGVLVYGSRKPINVGDVTDWSSVAASDPRTYALQAKVSKSLKPKFKNLPSSISIVSDLAPGSEIYQLAFDGVDGVEVPNYFTPFLDGFSEYFTYNESVNSVYIKSTPPKGKYQLGFTVKDLCGNKATGNLKVEVQTKLPAILNLPSAVSVREDSHNGEIVLHEINVVHSGSIACSLKSVEPSHGKRFFLVRNTNGSLPHVILKATAHLSYEAEDTYELSIKCAAGKDSDTGSLFVNIEPNSAPKFENLPSEVVIHADEGLIGGLIYHVMYSDEENNPVFYNVTCDPRPCPFDVTQGGSVTVTDDLRTAVSNIFYLEISIEDNFNVAGPEILVVNITGLNRPPFIYNLPHKATVTLAENSPPGTSVFQVFAVDQDETDNLTFSFRTKPTNMIPLFSINETTGVIYALSPFDYEGMKSKNIKVYPTVTDGMDKYEGALKVTIIDINEPPLFQYDNYTIFTGEHEPGKVIAKNRIKASDHDKGDAIVYHLDCGRETDLFQINEHTADITQSYELDVDRLGVAELEIMCTVSATDKVGQSSNATVRFVIADEDDNAPDFEKTSYLFVATKDLPVFTTLGRTFATDLDTASVNSKLFYYIEDETENFVSDDNGTIHLIADLAMVPVGTVFKFTMGVEDGQGKKDTAPVTIVVLPGNYHALVSTLVAKELTFLDLPENIAWFVTAVYLLIGIIIALLYLCGRSLRCTIELVEFDESRPQSFASGLFRKLSGQTSRRSSSVCPSDFSDSRRTSSTGISGSTVFYTSNSSAASSSRRSGMSPRIFTHTPRTCYSGSMYTASNSSQLTQRRSLTSRNGESNGSLNESNQMFSGGQTFENSCSMSNRDLSKNSKRGSEDNHDLTITHSQGEISDVINEQTVQQELNEANDPNDNEFDISKTNNADLLKRHSTIMSKLSSQNVPSVQSRLSLSDIQPSTRSRDQTPWKPWAISDFKKSFNKTGTIDSDYVSNGETKQSPTSKRKLSLNF
ncbi:plasma membrane adhesion molecule [Mactra antiquata]